MLYLKTYLDIMCMMADVLADIEKNGSDRISARSARDVYTAAFAEFVRTSHTVCRYQKETGMLSFSTDMRFFSVRESDLRIKLSEKDMRYVMSLAEPMDDITPGPLFYETGHAPEDIHQQVCAAGEKEQDGKAPGPDMSEALPAAGPEKEVRDETIRSIGQQEEAEDVIAVQASEENDGLIGEITDAEEDIFPEALADSGADKIHETPSDISDKKGPAQEGSENEETGIQTDNVDHIFSKEETVKSPCLPDGENEEALEEEKRNEYAEKEGPPGEGQPGKEDLAQGSGGFPSGAHDFPETDCSEDFSAEERDPVIDEFPDEENSEGPKYVDIEEPRHDVSNDGEAQIIKDDLTYCSAFISLLDRNGKTIDEIYINATPVSKTMSDKGKLNAVIFVSSMDDHKMEQMNVYKMPPSNSGEAFIRTAKANSLIVSLEKISGSRLQFSVRLPRSLTGAGVTCRIRDQKSHIGREGHLTISDPSYDFSVHVMPFSMSEGAADYYYWITSGTQDDTRVENMGSAQDGRDGRFTRGENAFLIKARWDNSIMKAYVDVIS